MSSTRPEWLNMDLLLRLLTSPIKARAQLEEVGVAVEAVKVAQTRIIALNQAVESEILDDLAGAAAAILAVDTAVKDFLRAVDDLFVAIGASEQDRTRVHAQFVGPMTVAMSQQRSILEQWIAATSVGAAPDA